MNFVVDDIVKGVSNNYCTTDKNMTRGRVLAIHGDEIVVRVISHKRIPSCLGSIHVVKAQYFEKIGHVKPFNRKEVLELITKGDLDKLNEYDFYGANLRNADLRGVNLSGADLRNADLRNADLNGANLRNANLSGANLRNADLRGVNLSGADLRNVNLSGANLRNADLRGVNLSGADLRNVNLSGADLRNADLSGAELRNADLRNADLRNADLSGANLRNANLSGADLMDIRYSECTSHFALACPEEGAFIGYKKADDHIVKLRITEDALRSSATSRKCRCSKAEVLSITTLDGEDDGTASVKSDYDSSFIYRVGTTVEVEYFEPDRWIECAGGIHFFITRQEAVQY